MKLHHLSLCLLLLTGVVGASAFDRPDVTFKVFQFPQDQMPRIDGKADDWAIVPESYIYGTDQMIEDSGKFSAPDPANLDIKVRVAWVKGMNRLYFLYEAYDNYWDFALPGLHNDTFEIMVDGDASGGPLIDQAHRDIWSEEEVGLSGATAARDERLSRTAAHWAGHGVHAQNYHIFTPAREKDWTMAWSSATWIKEFPWSNAVCSYDVEPGQPGRITLEFWVTAFDYAGPEGPQRAVESVLEENKIIGLSWCIIDYDDENARGNNGFWTLARHHKSFGNANYLCAFQLMPLEPSLQKPLEAQWSFRIVDMDRHLVAFKDESVGEVTSWLWDFDDGETSTEQHPLHAYDGAGGNRVVVLTVEGPAGTSRRSKVWDVQLK